MAALKKFTRSAALSLIRHVERSIINPSNKDIDPSRSHLNYSLNLNDGRTPAVRYKQRIAQLYVDPRKQTYTLAEWVVACPKDITDPEKEKAFFIATAQFIAQKYSLVNLVHATIHKDEAGQVGHLHMAFIPVVEDKNGKRITAEKVCAHDLLTRDHLRSWHGEFQAYLDEALPFKAAVYTGVTRRNGGNRTVRELKQADRDREQKNIRLNLNRERSAYER